jgi:hypothetical protein
MPPEDREKLNRIEEMKKKLFSKDYETRIEHRDGFTVRPTKEVPDSWGAKEKEENDSKQKFFMKTSMFKKFFIFSIIFLVLALGYGAYMFFAGGNVVSNDNIDITVLGNTFTGGGEQLPLQIEITNKNASALELADLLVEYPKSSSGDLSQDQNTERIRDSLGTIPAGGVRTDNVNVVIFGEQGSVRPIDISLEYRVEGSNAIFVKDKPYSVTISSAPINLLLNAPTEANPNQDITLNVKATLNATEPASKILLRMDYPVGFQFESANPVPSFGNNVWTLGDLSPGAERDISVTGKMIDVSDGEQKTFHVYSGSQSDSDSSVIGVVFNSLGQTINIKKPFIQAELYINGVYQSEYASDSSTPISGEIQWANNLDTKVDNLEIDAKISGNAFDRSSVIANQGYYNSSQNEIIWDKNSENSFAEVNPGDSGSVNFSLSPLSLFSASGGILGEPTINIDVSIKGDQPTLGDQTTQLNNSESKVIKIISNVGLANELLYYSGAFKNTGPIPPKADQETTYTVVWTLSNTSNNISNAEVRCTLPPGTRFIGPISPPAENLTYDPTAGQVVWEVGGIPSGTGITEADREVSFQIGFTPSITQIDTSPLIINDAVLTGHDDFANVDVTVNKSSLSTNLSNDPDFPLGGSRVSQ